ncbi:hypothetical protein Q1695_011293 [Nippostrongylus brasiliensis]|nr:hypothetical protein Q1695_011293 [Nippostrongylus brasiliensis]
MTVLRLLILAVLYTTGIAEDVPLPAIAFVDEANIESIDKTTNVKAVQTRAIDGTENEAQQSDGKFKLYVGTIDGVRREIFNEVEGEGHSAPDNSPNPSDPWGAYDDNTVIDTEDEKNLFVPKPYRPGSKDKSTTTTTTPAPVTSRPTLPPTTIRTIPFVQTTPAVRRPISVQSQFERPSTPSAPARFFPTAPPRQLPFQPKTIPQINPQLPAQPQPLRPRTRRPPVQPPTQPPFIPQQQQQQNFQRPFSPVQQPFQPIQQQRQPFIPQQPQFPPQQPQIPFSPQFQTVPPTTPAPQLPFAGQQNLRTGVCPMSIFYISTPISGPTRLSFTHFAIAVTVDQCARTCHEFNCAIAHYSPSNGHCEFNPSTAFAIRNGQCPAWPSLHYRNNVVANEPVRIFCVTCQRPRRRQNRNRNGLRQRGRDARHGTNLRRGVFRAHRNAKRTANSASSPNLPIIHGFLVRQPKAIALGVSQMSFDRPIGTENHEIAVGVSPTLFEVGADSQEQRRSSGSSKI